MTRPVLLDLFCGAGGAAVGYHRAGFDVIGVDIAPQPNYPFEFHQMDAFAACHVGFWRADAWDRWLVETIPFDAVHASPPCQAHTGVPNRRDDHYDVLEDTRYLLQQLPTYPKGRRMVDEQKRQELIGVLTKYGRFTTFNASECLDALLDALAPDPLPDGERVEWLTDRRYRIPESTEPGGDE